MAGRPFADNPEHGFALYAEWCKKYAANLVDLKPSDHTEVYSYWLDGHEVDVAKERFLQRRGPLSSGKLGT